MRHKLWLAVIALGLISRLWSAEPTGIGSITMSPTGDVTAGSRMTFHFVYTVGAQGIREGGSIRITTPNEAWSTPLVPVHRNFLPEQALVGKDGGYFSFTRCDTTVELVTKGTAWIDLATEDKASTGDVKLPGNLHIIGWVKGGNLAPGDQIALTYGDKRFGEEGAQVSPVAPTDRDHFRAFVDVSGDAKFKELTANNLAQLHVIPGPPTRFNIVAPSIVRVGEPFTVKFAATDAFNNRPTGNYTGQLRVSSQRPEVKLRGFLDFDGTTRNYAELKDVVVLKEGVHRIYAESADGSERWISNPIWCTAFPANLYFGNLHAHGQYHSNSIGSPDELYAYGRYVSCLDFMSDADSWGYKNQVHWQETLESTRKNYAPGKFVTFKGFEYGAEVGHRNVIYRDTLDEPGLAFLPINDTAALFHYYHGKDVVIIPHHTKVWTEWKYRDPVLEPLVEVYSAWGSGVERDDPLWHKATKPGSGVFSLLEEGGEGSHVGFVGAGDSHSGMPGRSYPSDRFWMVGQKEGFACVFAPELTREAIFDALRAKHCYATTGARMILQFTVNGAGMGQETTVASSRDPRCLLVHAIGTDLKLIRVLKNDKELFRRDVQGDEATFEFYDPEPAKTGDYYFVRVVQQDDNTAWSSPIWVAVPEAKKS